MIEGIEIKTDTEDDHILEVRVQSEDIVNVTKNKRNKNTPIVNRNGKSIVKNLNRKSIDIKGTVIADRSLLADEHDLYTQQ